jgi:hypothetical protein
MMPAEGHWEAPVMLRQMEQFAIGLSGEGLRSKDFPG